MKKIVVLVILCLIMSITVSCGKDNDVKDTHNTSNDNLSSLISDLQSQVSALQSQINQNVSSDSNLNSENSNSSPLVYLKDDTTLIFNNDEYISIDNEKLKKYTLGFWGQYEAHSYKYLFKENGNIVYTLSWTRDIENHPDKENIKKELTVNYPSLYINMDTGKEVRIIYYKGNQKVFFNLDDIMKTGLI